MSYRIDYGMGVAERKELPKKKGIKWKNVAIIAAVIGALVLGRQAARSMFALENSEAVETFSQMYSSIYEGQSIWESIEQYCTQMLRELKYGG